MVGKISSTKERPIKEIGDLTRTLLTVTPAKAGVQSIEN